MRVKNNLKPFLLGFKIIFLGCILVLSGCNKEEDEAEPANDNPIEKSYTVTVGVYILNGSTYEDQDKSFVFETQETCQSWSRTAQGDTHNSSPHEHYNAAKNTTYNSDNETITWTEYGPELDQASINTTCEAGRSGVTKTANKVDYSADKNFFLKIKSVVEN